MAEFGPKIFHALGMYGDKERNSETFLTASPSMVGLNPDNNKTLEEDIASEIEVFKNSIFKLLMFRARNMTARLGEEATNRLLDEAGVIPVNLTLYLGPDSIHPNKSGLRTLEVRNLIVSPDYWDSKDTEKILQSIKTQALACAPQKSLDAALENSYKNGAPVLNEDEQERDPIYADLWG